MDDEAIAVPMRGEFLSPREVRRLTRYACDQRLIGWEALVDEVIKGAPIYPMVDELVNACVDAIKLKFPDVGPDDEIEFRFEAVAEPRTAELAIRHVQRKMQGRIGNFYLDLFVRSNEKDLLLLLQCFFELYDQISSDGVVTVKGSH